MTHDYHRTAEAARQDDDEFGNVVRSPDILPGAGIIALLIAELALIAAGLWAAFG